MTVGRLSPPFRWSLCCLLSIAFASSLAAQSIDPDVLRTVQSQLGSTTASTSRPSSSVTNTPAVPSGPVDTVEEQELRRARANIGLRELYAPSRIEQDYRDRLDLKDLRQFGYDFFRNAPPPTGSRTGNIGDDYVLGVGDELQVNLRGSVNHSQSVRVDRDGRVLVDGLAPVMAAGQSLGTVRRELQAETRRSLLATDIFITVGEVRAISVFVGGEVARAGQFTLTSMSGMATAIAEAGGVRRSGTLRRVRVVRANGTSVTVDLYGLLGIGRPPDVHLRDGDRVIVPVIGPTVAITGSVARPGIYELAGRETVADAVNFAGGAIRQRGAQVVISRIAEDGSENFLRALAGSEKVAGGDAIEVIGGSAGGVIDRVRLEGAVANPGARSLQSVRTVADLVGPAANLPADAYRLAAVLMRRDPMTGARVYQLVALAQELHGRAATRLQADDRLFVLSRRDIEYLNSPLVRRVVLGQRNPLRQCVSLQQLETLVRDTSTERFNAVTRGGFVVLSDSGAELGAVGSALGQSSAQATDLAISGQLQDGDDQIYPPMLPPAMSPGLNQGVRPGGAGNVGNSATGGVQYGIASRDPSGERPLPCTEVFEQQPDLLPVLLEHSVSISGAVRQPGAYPVAGSATARDLALVAGGVIASSGPATFDITHAVGGAGQQLMAAVTDDALLVPLNVGDDLRVSIPQTEFENSAVMLSGEVNHPGLYTIRRGETLAQLLERAGGVTGLAYPYGTVFTRRSVRDSQRAGLQRTARELNNSLLAVAARSTGNNSSLAGAAQLIRSLSETEVSGRMVVEADPRVLRLRPDLDTVLEAGDSIFVPKRPSFVLALGDVNNPGALQFIAGKSAADYLREAGGALSTADNRRAFLVLPDGTAQPLRDSRAGGAERMTPPPGSTIIVPKNIDPLYKLSIIRDVTTIFAQVASSVATVAVLATR